MILAYDVELPTKTGKWGYMVRDIYEFLESGAKNAEIFVGDRNPSRLANSYSSVISRRDDFRGKVRICSTNGRIFLIRL